MEGRRYEAGGIRRTVRLTRGPTTRRCSPGPARSSTRCAARARPPSRSRAATASPCTTRSARCGSPASLTPETTFLGAHVVPVEFADNPDAYVDLVTGAMLDACAPSRAGSTSSARPAPSPSSRAAASSRPEPPAGSACGARRAARRVGRRAARRRTRRGERRPRHLPLRSGCRGACRIADGRHAASRRRVLDPAAVSLGASSARRRRHGRDRNRLQPGLVVHLIHPVLHRPRGARDGDDAARGPARRDRRRGPRAASRRRRRTCGSGRPAGSCCSMRRARRTLLTVRGCHWCGRWWVRRTVSYAERRRSSHRLRHEVDPF